jgi:hypothetical protein
MVSPSSPEKMSAADAVNNLPNPPAQDYVPKNILITGGAGFM